VHGRGPSARPAQRAGRTRTDGAADAADIETLQRQVATLRQNVVELNEVLDERNCELAAAGAANRELVVRLNAVDLGTLTGVTTSCRAYGPTRTSQVPPPYLTCARYPYIDTALRGSTCHRGPNRFRLDLWGS
jgi:hypothetical protein